MPSNYIFLFCSCVIHEYFYCKKFEVIIIIIVNDKEVYGIIYKITNTITNQSYIGQTKTKRGFKSRYCHKGEGIERVYKFHLYLKNKGETFNEHLFYSIEKYGFDAFEITEVLDTAMSAEELDEKEIYYIDYYDSYNNGFNLTLGGERGCGENQPKGKDNPLSRSVCQLTLNGKLVKIWDSLADIRRSGKYNVPNIELTCQGVNSHSYGYLWVFKEDYDPNKEYKWVPSKIYRAVVLVDENNNLLKEFVSVVQASRDMHVDRKTVRDSCNGVWDKPKYNFKYKDKYIEEQRLNEKGFVA